MIYRHLVNTTAARIPLIDVCIPCWELSAKLRMTLDGLMRGAGRLSVPARILVNVDRQSVVLNRFACLKESQSPYVLWLDDDVLFEAPGWDARLLDRISRDPSIGVIGIRVKHWQQGDRTPLRPEGDVADVCGAVMMTRRIPGVEFDSNYIGSQWEDTDYCYAVRSAGFRVVQDNTVAVLHYNEEKNRNHTHNQAYFLSKWRRAS